MSKILTFSTGYNDLHVSVKNMTKFLDILEESKFVSMEYAPGDENYANRVGVIRDNDTNLGLTDAPPYMDLDSWDHQKEILRQEAENATAQAERSDA